MKIINNNGVITIDCENNTVVYVNKDEKCVNLEGFNDEIQFGGYNNCIFLSKKKDEKFTFGQYVTISGKNYRYIGIDNASQKGRLLFWDEINGCIMLGK